MNIAEILKDCPKGSKLYSPIFGEVKLIEVNIEVNSEDIIVETCKSTNAYFDIQGRFKIGYDNAECMLFPSRENRDWSTFKKKEYEFKPFNKVLVRDFNDQYWRCSIFSHINSDVTREFCCVSGSWKQCIPYKGNEHLLGTTKNPD